MKFIKIISKKKIIINPKQLELSFENNSNNIKQEDTIKNEIVTQQKVVKKYLLKVFKNIYDFKGYKPKQYPKMYFILNYNKLNLYCSKSNLLIENYFDTLQQCNMYIINNLNILDKYSMYICNIIDTENVNFNRILSTKYVILDTKNNQNKIIKDKDEALKKIKNNLFKLYADFN